MTNRVGAAVYPVQSPRTQAPPDTGFQEPTVMELPGRDDAVLSTRQIGDKPVWATEWIKLLAVCESFPCHFTSMATTSSRATTIL